MQIIVRKIPIANQYTKMNSEHFVSQLKIFQTYKQNFLKYYVYNNTLACLRLTMPLNVFKCLLMSLLALWHGYINVLLKM